MKVGDYPGIYHMVEIPPEDWHLLPEVPPGMDSVNLDSEAEERLERAGYIVGRLHRVIFHDPGIKDTNWSATAPVTGPDRVQRRWVYLHYFKDGQPSINWLDPTFAEGERIVVSVGTHTPLSVDLTLEYAEATIALECADAFAFDPLVVRQPIGTD